MAGVPSSRASAKKATARTSATKKAATKKAAAKKSAVKKTAAKNVATKRAAAKKAASIESAPREPTPVEAQEPDAQAVEAARVESDSLAINALDSSPTLIERVLEASWRTTLRVAVTSGLVLMAVASAVATAALMTDKASSAGTAAYDAHPSLSEFVRLVAMIAGTAFDSPLKSTVDEPRSSDLTSSLLGTTTTSSTTFIPLTITVIVLGVFALMCRRYIPRERPSNAIAATLRAGLVFAGLATVLTSFGRISQSSGDIRIHQSISATHVFIWSFILSSAVGLLVVGWPWLMDRIARSERHGARLSSYRLPLQGGLVALATAVVLGGLSFIIAVFIDGGEHGASVGDVARLLPIFFGFLMNIGTAIIGIAMGGKLSGNFGGIADDEVSFGFAHLHGPSMFYLFLLVLPLIACLTGLRWIVRHRRGESPRAVSRACYRMAVPFALGWLALAYVGRIGLDTGRPIGGFHFGPQLFVGFLLALGWSGLLGAFYGRILLRRGTKLAARFPRAAPRRGPSWLVVSIVATAMIVGSGSAAVALHDDSGAGSSAVNSTPEPTPSESPPDVGELLPDPGLTAPPAEPRSDPVGDATARAVLTATAAAEERYRTKHGAYSSYDFELDSSPAPDGVALVVAYADSRRFCATASWYDSDVTYTYDSAVGKVQEGDNCDDISGSSTN